MNEGEGEVLISLGRWGRGQKLENTRGGANIRATRVAAPQKLMYDL